MYDEITGKGAQVSAKRTQHEVSLSEEGFDAIERVRVRTPERSDNGDATIVLERTGHGITLSRHSTKAGIGDFLYEPLDISDEHYGPFLLGKSAKGVDGYFVVPRGDLEIQYGPLVSAPKQLGKNWIGTFSGLLGASIFLGRGSSSEFPSGYGPSFRGTPELFGESYLVQDGNKRVLVSAEDPSLYSIEFVGRPMDDGRFWRVALLESSPDLRSTKKLTNHQQSVARFRKRKESLDAASRRPLYALIDKQNLTKSIGFDTIEDLGDAYLIDIAGQLGQLVDKRADKEPVTVFADDGKNLLVRDEEGTLPVLSTTRFVQRAHPSVTSIPFRENLPAADGAHLVGTFQGGTNVFYLISVDDVSVHTTGFAEGPWSNGDRWVVRLEEAGRYYAIPKDNLRQHFILPAEYTPPEKTLVEEMRSAAEPSQ